MPDADARAEFSRSVLDKVSTTFARQGVPLALTTDPGASSAHTLSVVSNASYASNPDAAGITSMGNDGFSFIDKLSYASSPDELEQAVANNIAPELLHAFNVDHQDPTGNYLDAAVASWDLLSSPEARFSAEAIAELAWRDLRTRNTPVASYAAQDLARVEATRLINRVPEPPASVTWVVVGTALFLARRRVVAHPRRKAW